MTRAQIVRRAQLLAGTRASKTVDGQDWLDLFDLVYEEVAREGRCIPFSYTTSIVASQRTYMAPTYALGINKEGVSLNGSTYVTGILDGPASVRVVELHDRLWATQTGAPNRWYFAEQLVTSGSDTNWGIGLYPVPAGSDSNALIMKGWRMPTAIATDAGVPAFPAGYHDTISYGMAYYAAVQDARNDEKLWVHVDRLAAHYEHRINGLRSGYAGFVSKTWVRGGEAPGWTSDIVDNAPFQVTVTSSD